MTAPDPDLPPWHLDTRGAWYRLQAMDRSLLGAPSLYLAASEGVGCLPHATCHDLRPDDWIGTGTLRNSLYLSPWARLTRAGEMALILDVEGHLRLRVLCAVAQRAPVTLHERVIDAPSRSRHVVNLGDLGALPDGGRLFWHLDAIDGARLHQAAWCTRTPPRPRTGLAVLLRTWGRSRDLRAQLERFVEGARHDPWHLEILRRTGFWVLDTSDDAGPAWHDAGTLGLRLQVIAAPNLGGGGNASHLLHLFLRQLDAAGPEDGVPDEVLILDDDLLLSMESLARHWMHCALRRGEHVCSLPVLMKSRPTQVWEDGGYWGRPPGRPGPAAAGGQPERGLAPSLLKHGLSLQGFEHLDAFGPLNHCEYATFIFLSLPLSALRRIGLPVAFFLRGDDIEYSLRAGAAGLPVVTDPNLAAWHEPGHSHAQEYMAILHGVLINFGYGPASAASLSRWFERRLAEHAAIDDLDGIRLYLAVLEAVLDTDGALLTPCFEAHYRRHLPRVQGPRMEVLATAEFERLARGEAAANLRVLPFLYPGMPPAEDTRPTLLLHHGAAAVRQLEPAQPAERLALMNRYLATLAQCVERFDVLATHWRQRLHDAGTTGFWAQVAARHAPLTRTLLVAPFRLESPDRPDDAADRTDPVIPAPVPVRELRLRMERDLAELARLRRAEPQRAAGPARTGWSGLLGRWLAGSRPARPASGAQAPLPADFDPAQYLALNQDVARTGIDAALHYRRFGRAEGRRYRL